MRTVILGPRPPEIDALIARRHALGNDRFDEIWEGDYHMNPAPRRRHAVLVGQLIILLARLTEGRDLEAPDGVNIGDEGNFRIPDGALLRPGPDEVYLETAALVFEVLSPGDETWEKFPHYAACAVGEILVVDPDAHTIEIFVLTDGEYLRSGASPLLGASRVDLESAVKWTN